MKVVAVIPNYNMGAELVGLINVLKRQKYDQIVVIDDKSTDDSLQILSEIKDIKLIQSDKNAGAGATRNKVIGEVPGDSILHFIDADMTLNSNETPDIIKQLFKDEPDASLFVGLILNTEGVPHEWNYMGFYSPTIRHYSRVFIHVFMFRFFTFCPVYFRRKLYKTLLKDWSDIFAEPVYRRVKVSIEGSFAIKASVFEELGGFDPKLREHEAQDFGIRLDKLGYKSYFSPLFSVTHKAIQARGSRRSTGKLALKYIAKKHKL